MERFYIITNLMKDPDYGITKEIQKYIEQHGRECILAKEDEQGFIFPGTVPENVDCGIVLEQELRELIFLRGADTDVTLTGIRMCDSLLGIADHVSDIEQIK